MKSKILGIGLVIVTTLTNSYATNIDTESCYVLGVKFGDCVQRSSQGLLCKAGTDFVMPKRCRHNSDNDRGMRDGMSGDPKGVLNSSN